MKEVVGEEGSRDVVVGESSCVLVLGVVESALEECSKGVVGSRCSAVCSILCDTDIIL